MLVLISAMPSCFGEVGIGAEDHFVGNAAARVEDVCTSELAAATDSWEGAISHTLSVRVASAVSFSSNADAKTI